MYEFWSGFDSGLNIFGNFYEFCAIIWEIFPAYLADF